MSNPIPDPAERERMSREYRIGWHARGGWCRKFPGDANRTYFGRVPARDAVRAMHAEEARRKRGEAAEAKLTALRVFEAVRLYLEHVDGEHAAGRMSTAQRASYGDELLRFLAVIGRTRYLSDLCKMSAPEAVFRPLRVAAVTRGLAAGEKHIVQVRTFLDWCSRVRRFCPPPFYADAFDPPAAREKMAARKADRKAHGEANWTPAEVREIVEAARGSGIHPYAWVLLMLNGGMGATDLSELTDGDVDWSRGCIHTDRSKTLVPRVVPLWDVTAGAMRASRAARREPADPKWADRFFLTPGGLPLVHKVLSDDGRREKGADAVKNVFYAMLNPPKRKNPIPGVKPRGRKRTIPSLPHLKRYRAGAYTLRSIFATQSAGQDSVLVAVIMGHKMSVAVMEHYLRGDLLDKLRGVTEHVRLQIWPEVRDTNPSGEPPG